MGSVFAAIMLVLFVFAASACDDTSAEDGDSAATATIRSASPSPASGQEETATMAPVPGLFVVETLTGAGTGATPGTRCWGNMCVDYAGPVTATDPVTFQAANELGWLVEGGIAEELLHAWVPREGATVEDSGDGTLSWTGFALDYAPGDIIVPGRPGEYLLSIFIRYSSGDDVEWGLYVTVE